MAWHFIDVAWWGTSKCHHIWQVEMLFLGFSACEVVGNKLSFPFDFHWSAVNKTETFIFQNLVRLFCNLKKGKWRRYYQGWNSKRSSASQSLLLIDARLEFMKRLWLEKKVLNVCVSVINRVTSWFPILKSVKNNKSKWHTQAPTHGLSSTLRMRTAISSGQWQPWTVVSALLGLISMA